MTPENPEIVAVLEGTDLVVKGSTTVRRSRPTLAQRGSFVVDRFSHHIQYPETIGRFFNAVDGYESIVTRLGRLGHRARHPHPWFGPMTAHDWHCLAAIHHWVHRRQLERIVRQLPQDTRTKG